MVSVKWWGLSCQFYCNFHELWRPYGAQDFWIGDSRLEIIVKIIEEITFTLGFYGATFFFQLREREKLGLFEIQFDYIVTFPRLQQCFAWGKRDIGSIWDSNWTIYFFAFGVNWSRFHENCGIYWTHGTQIYNFWTDLHIVNRSTSWTDLLQGFEDRSYKSTGILWTFHKVGLDLLLDDLWSYFPFTSHCWCFEAFITQIQWILMHFFNTWKKEGNPGLNKGTFVQQKQPNKPSQAKLQWPIYSQARPGSQELRPQWATQLQEIKPSPAVT